MKRTPRSEKGAALLIAVLMMLVFVLFLMTLAQQAATDADMAIKYLDRVRAFYIAEAGIARSRVAHAKQISGWSSLPVNQTENFGEGNFTISITAAEAINAGSGEGPRLTARVNLTSTGNLPATSPRTTRVIDEKWLERDITAFTSSHKNGMDGIQAINHDGTATWWEHGSGTQPEDSWIYIDFGVPRKFNKVVFTLANGSGTLEAYEIDTWDETQGLIVGLAEPGWWGIIFTKSSGGPAAGATETVTFASVQTTQRIKLDPLTVTGGGGVRLQVAEIAAYCEGAPCGLAAGQQVEVRNQYVLKSPNQYGSSSYTGGLRNGTPLVDPTYTER